MRNAGFFHRDIRQPGKNSGKINGSRSSDMLQMDLGKSNITSLSQIKGVYALRESALNPSTFSIFCLEGLRFHILAQSLQCHKLHLRSKG